MSEIGHASPVSTGTTSRTAGEQIERHRHREHQLVYVSSGVVAIGTARGSWVATPDRAVWVPAGVWHEHRFYGRSVFHSIGFATGSPPLPATSPTVVSATGLVRELVMACTEPDLPTAEEARIRRVLRDRLRRLETVPLSQPRAQDPRLARACDLVTDDLSRPRPLPALAREVGTSTRTLTRLFRDELGTTYPQWRTQARVLRALVELAEGATVTQAGRRCGWATPSAFIDAFTTTMGQTPGAYRSAAHAAASTLLPGGAAEGEST